MVNSTQRISFHLLGTLLAGATLALAACGGDSAPPPPAAKVAQPAQKSTPVAALPAPAKPAVAAVAPTPQKADPNRELAARVKKALEADPKVNGQSIDVTAASGAITLWGAVADEGERRTASRIAGAVDGVQSVDNRLVIAKGS